MLRIPGWLESEMAYGNAVNALCNAPIPDSLTVVLATVTPDLALQFLASCATQ
jgi:hypothetical protein